MAKFRSVRPRDEAGRSFLNGCVEEAQQQRQQYEPQWHENWANYRVESFNAQSFPSKQYPLASGVGPIQTSSRGGISPVNFLKTAETHQGINTLRALLLASLFGVREYVAAAPVGDEDVESAKRVSRLTMYGLERPGNFRTNFELLGDALIAGFGSYSARFDEEFRLVPRRFPVPDPTAEGGLLLDENGNVMTVLQNVEIPVRSDPLIETDNIFDTWFDPSANRFHDVGWKAKRVRYSTDALEALVDEQDPNWDLEGLRMVLEFPPDAKATGPDADSRPKLMTENLTEEDVEPCSKYGVYGGWQFEGKIPSDVADDLGLDHRGTVVFQMIHGTMVQAIQSPQRDGEIQGGGITVLPTGQGVYGLSPATVVRYLQDVSDTQMILTTQALIESVYQNYLIGGSLGPGVKRMIERRKPRQAMVLEGDVEQVQMLPKDYSGLQIAVGALSVYSQAIRNAMNARDPVQGVINQGGGDTTATESQLVAASALQNTDQLAVLIERDELPRLGKLINDLYYINLSDEGQVFQRVGDTETTLVNYFDIDHTKDITFIGARSLISKAGMANQFRDFANVLASNPFTAAAVDWHEFVRRYGDEVLDVKGLEQLMIQDPEEIVARMQALGLAQTVGGAGKGGAGVGGGAPPANTRRTAGSGGRTGGSTPTQTAGESSSAPN